MASFKRYYNAATVIKKSWDGRYRKENMTTKKWIIVAITSNHAEDLTRAIAVASIQRYYDAATVINAGEQTTGVGEIERRSSDNIRVCPARKLHNRENYQELWKNKPSQVITMNHPPVVLLLEAPAAPAAVPRVPVG